MEKKIKNEPKKGEVNEKCALFRSAIEHRAVWGGLLIEEAKKQGMDTAFAHEAIKKCGIFQGNSKYTKTSDLKAFSKEFGNKDVIDAFEMEFKERNDEHLYIDFHYCPLVAAWLKLGLPESDIPELCEIAMDGDRGIISTFPDFRFKLGKTIAKGDNVCEIRIDKVKK